MTTLCFIGFIDKDEQTARNLIAFEPRCAVCLRSEYNMRTADVKKDDDNTGAGASYGSLIPCSTCLGTFACSPAHWAAYEHEHKSRAGEEGTGLSECEMNVRAAEDDALIARMGEHRRPWVPERRRSAYLPLPSGDADAGMSAWAKWFADPANIKEVPAPGFSQVAERLCTEPLSIPLTILYGIGLFDDMAKGNNTSSVHKRPLHERVELEVAILGAASYELAQGGMSFEELLHSLPAVRKLTIRLVGPELGEIVGFEFDGKPMDLDTCPRCARRVSVHIHQTNTFHDYVLQGVGERRMPDIAVAFNAGMHENEASKAGWAPSVKMLAKEGVPTIVTSYQVKEAEADGAFLRDMGCNIVIPSHINPWRSELAIKEPCGARGFYFVNGFIQGFKGTA